MDTVRINVDLPYDMKLQEFLELLDRYSASLVMWHAVGPAGGNPYVRLSLKKSEAVKLMKELEG